MDSGNRFHLTTCSIDMRIDPKDVDHGVRMLLSVRGGIQAKRGCRACEVGIEASEPGLVHYREEWESEDVFHQHVQSEEFRRVLIALDLCCEEPRIVFGNLSGRTGMADLLNLRENVTIPGAFD
jgi:quinol monooxygenase YgiN